MPQREMENRLQNDELPIPKIHAAFHVSAQHPLIFDPLYQQHQEALASESAD